MKELSIEEKAQRYDNAIEIAKSLYDYNQPISASNVIINNIFPEFKDSENERIRKWLVEEIYKSVNSSANKGFDIDMGKMALAWLEKQSKQKPWSEDDTKHFLRCLGYIEAYVEPRKDDVRWFKSLKDRYIWKPSDEQMKSLAWVVEHGNTCQTAKLKEILEQLKAL